MNGEILATAVVLGKQEHSPPAGAHVTLVAGLVVAALAIFGVRWWRGRRDAAAPDENARTGGGTRSTEDE